MAAASPGKNVTLVARGREGRAALLQRPVASGAKTGTAAGSPSRGRGYRMQLGRVIKSSLRRGGCLVFSG